MRIKLNMIFFIIILSLLFKGLFADEIFNLSPKNNSLSPLQPFKWLPAQKGAFYDKVSTFFQITDKTLPLIYIDSETKKVCFEKKEGIAYPCLYYISAFKKGLYTLNFTGKTNIGETKTVSAFCVIDRNQFTLNDTWKNYHLSYQLPIDIQKSHISLGVFENGKSWFSSISLTYLPILILNACFEGKSFIITLKGLEENENIFTISLWAYKTGNDYLISKQNLKMGKKQSKINLPCDIKKKETYSFYFTITNPGNDTFLYKSEEFTNRKEKTQNIVNTSASATVTYKKTYDENGNLLIAGNEILPVGIYTHKMDLTWVKKLGLNTIICPLEGDYGKFLEEANKSGIMVIPELSVSADPQKFGQEIDKLAEKYMKYPFLAWSVVDEPDLKPEYRDVMYFIQSKIRQIDPYRPIFTTNHTASSFSHFMPATDILAIDPYPVAKLPRPLYQVVYWMEEAKKAQKPGQAVWFIPQAFCMYPVWPVPPSPQEEKAMVYLALNHGAKGIMFYALVEILNKDGDPPEYLWHLEKSNLKDTVIEIASDLKKLGPIFLSTEKPDISVKTDKNLPIDIAVFSHNGKTYISAVNMEKCYLNVFFKISGLKNTVNIKEFHSLREISPHNKGFNDTFKPYDTKIYELDFSPPWRVEMTDSKN